MGQLVVKMIIVAAVAGLAFEVFANDGLLFTAVLDVVENVASNVGDLIN